MTNPRRPHYTDEEHKNWQSLFDFKLCRWCGSPHVKIVDHNHEVPKVDFKEYVCPECGFCEDYDDLYS